MMKPSFAVFVKHFLSDTMFSARIVSRAGMGLLSKRLIVTDASLGLTHVMAELNERLERRRGRHVEKIVPPSLVASADRGLVLSSDLTRAADLVVGKEGLTVYKDLLLRKGK